MATNKTVQYGCDVLEQLITLSNRFLCTTDKAGQERIAYASISDMLNLLRSTKIPSEIPFAPEWGCRYGTDWPMLSRIISDLLDGHYKKACWNMEDMLRCAQGSREPFFMLNQFRWLLEYWAGAGYMSLRQRLFASKEKVAEDAIRKSYYYALSQLHELAGPSKADRVRLMMRIIKNDIKFSSLAGILKENPARPQQVNFYIPVSPVGNSIETRMLDSVHTDVVITPYQTGKFKAAMADLVNSSYQADMDYHDGIYWPELDMAIMRNGIHHASIGLTRDEVVTLKAEVVPLTPWFDRVETDGVKWTVREDAETRIHEVIDFRFALLFELAKMLRHGK